MDWLTLLIAIAQIESGFNPNAIGDNGKAYGMYQIHAINVADVNRIYGTSYTHRDAFDQTKARRICILYLKHYGKHYEKTTGKKPTVYVYATIWNGGPYGWRKFQTQNYGDKVRTAYINRMKGNR